MLSRSANGAVKSNRYGVELPARGALDGRYHTAVRRHFTGGSEHERQGTVATAVARAPYLLTDAQYLMAYARVGIANSNADDVQTGEKLWTWLEEQVKDI